VQVLGGHVAVAVGEEELGESDPLARRPQAGASQQLAGVDAR
jgi:hypothetical protein